MLLEEPEYEDGDEEGNDHEEDEGGDEYYNRLESL
jgi:hypothetical protein